MEAGLAVMGGDHRAEVPAGLGPRIAGAQPPEVGMGTASTLHVVATSTALIKRVEADVLEVVPLPALKPRLVSPNVPIHSPREVPPVAASPTALRGTALLRLAVPHDAPVIARASVHDAPVIPVALATRAEECRGQTLATAEVAANAPSETTPVPPVFGVLSDAMLVAASALATPVLDVPTDALVAAAPMLALREADIPPPVHGRAAEDPEDHTWHGVPIRRGAALAVPGVVLVVAGVASTDPLLIPPVTTASTPRPVVDLVTEAIPLGQLVPHAIGAIGL